MDTPARSCIHCVPDPRDCREALVSGQRAPFTLNEYRPYVSPLRLQRPPKRLQGSLGRRPRFSACRPLRHMGHDVRDLVVFAAMMPLDLEADENAGRPGREPDGNVSGVRLQLPGRRPSPFHVSKCFGRPGTVVVHGFLPIVHIWCQVSDLPRWGPAALAVRLDVHARLSLAGGTRRPPRCPCQALPCRRHFRRLVNRPPWGHTEATRARSWEMTSGRQCVPHDRVRPLSPVRDRSCPWSRRRSCCR